MKRRPIWILIVLVTVAVGLVSLEKGSESPTLDQFARSFEDALRASPREETVQSLVKVGKFNSGRREAPFDENDKDMLFSNGISKPDIARASSFIWVGPVNLRGGSWFASYEGSGCFMFADDGTLISYHIDAANFGM